MVWQRPGLSDSELGQALGMSRQRVNTLARRLSVKGPLLRRRRADGLLGTFPRSLSRSEAQTTYVFVRMAPNGGPPARPGGEDPRRSLGMSC